MSRIAKIMSAVAVFSVICGVFTRADLEVKLDVEHNSIIRFEDFNAEVTLVNKTGEPFVMYRDGTSIGPRFSFTVERNGEEIKTRSKDPFFEKVVIMPDGKKTATRDLTRWYNLSQEGQYLVVAQVEWDGTIYRSATRVLRVVGGISLAETSRSLSDDPRIHLTYSVRYWPRHKKDHAFLYVHDKKNSVNYGALDMGPILRVSKPRIKVDADDNVTVVHRANSDCIVRSRFRASKNGIASLGQELFLPSGERITSFGKSVR
ncbi:MAG: hypothetical protein ACOC6C_01940 [Verrucomicrobiota bacterium]